MNKLLDSDDEDLGNITDTSSICSRSSKGSNPSCVTKIKDKENNNIETTTIDPNNNKKTRRKSCFPDFSGTQPHPSVTRVTRYSIKTPMSPSKDTLSKQMMTLELQKVFDFDEEDVDEDTTPLAHLTQSGRKTKQVNPTITKNEDIHDNDDDNDYDYEAVARESESESEQIVSDKDFGSDGDDVCSDSDFEEVSF